MMITRQQMEYKTHENIHETKFKSAFEQPCCNITHRSNVNVKVPLHTLCIQHLKCDIHVYIYADMSLEPENYSSILDDGYNKYVADEFC